MKNKSARVFYFKLTLIAVFFIFTTAVYAKWSFGVHGDTQWTQDQDPTGENPNYVSAAIASALNKQFIAKGVKFVIQVGDLTDRAGDDAMYTRSGVAQSLYGQGIGFFPLRGNHEEYGYMYGLDPHYNLNIPAFLDAFPQTQGGGANTVGAYKFNSPSINALQGLSYSFDYGNTCDNARFIIVDVEATSIKHQAAPVDQVYGQGYFYVGFFTVYRAPYDLSGVTTTYDENGKAVNTDMPITISNGTWFRIDSKGRPSTNFYAWDMLNPGQGAKDIYWPIDNNISKETNSTSGTEFWPGKQQSWISGQLDKSTRGTEHAFVFSHRGLMNANHVDCLFGADPSVTPADQNAFYASLMNNGVKYMISGHDHLYNRALLKSPDGLSQVEQIISVGASPKFYSPASLNSFPANVKQRETQISQEINNIGYYIYTIDGPRVTVDYYSDAVGNFGDAEYYPDGDPNAVPPKLGSLSVPKFNFVKKETWGYSLNGKEFLVGEVGKSQQSSFTVVADTSKEGTIAKILSGDNTCTAYDYESHRPFTKVINTGWASNDGSFRSSILTLWGMADFGTPDVTAQFTLSMSYNSSTVGACALMSRKDDDSPWVNAVDMNTGGAKKFVAGPYKSSYGLGTYGIDFSTKTVWAVVNHASDFAVHSSTDGDLNGDGVIDGRDISIIATNLNKPASVYPEADLDNDGKITVLDLRKETLLQTK